MTTLLDTLSKGTAYLEKKGVDSPRLTMELLVSHVLEMQRMQLYLEFDRPLKEPELKKLRELLRKRGERIPLQHLLGSVEFFGREFICDARALIPRPETEELIEHVLTLHLPSKPKILDLCSGTGVIGITLKKELPEAEVTLADLSSEALSLSQENAETLEAEVSFISSDLYENIPGRYDLIISNPPYVSTEVELEEELSHDPALALYSGADGLDLIRRIVPESLAHLNHEGWLALEIGYDQSDYLRLLLESSDYKEVEIRKDMEKIARFPIARKA